ncbi:acetate--CoA ligase family protein [Candidatus Woesearchaeota archaeon]|nr:acetate--CoA ligase family protein [Candidatus Woesearchaeota archaeon]
MRILAEKEAETFLEKEGFPLARRSFSKTSKGCIDIAAKIGYPVALKISSHKIIHKSDVHGVKLDLRNEKEVKHAFEQISKIKGFEQAMVEEFNQGHFLLFGIKKDPSFGHVIAVGSGGIYTELFKDVSFRVVPLERKDAEEMIKEIKIYPVLLGKRGEKPAD